MKILYFIAIASCIVFTNTSFAGDQVPCRIVWKSGNVMSPTFTKGKWKTPNNGGGASVTSNGIRMKNNKRSSWVRFLSSSRKIVDDKGNYAGKFSKSSLKNVKSAIQKNEKAPH